MSDEGIPLDPTCPRCDMPHGIEVSGDGYTHDCKACCGHLICAIGDEGEMYPYQRGDRDERQVAIHEWCVAAFGREHATNLAQRGVRLLEEAVEAYQAAGGTEEMARKLVEFVFARPAGNLAQELGGVGVTLLALAHAAGLSADGEEDHEVERVLSKPIAHFAKRNEAKNAAGFNVIAPVDATGGK